MRRLSAYLFLFTAALLLVACPSSPTSPVTEVDFTWTQKPGTLSVTFVSTVLGGNAKNSYKWNFGDGETSTQENPIRVYEVPGNKTVTLEVCPGSTTTTKCASVSKPITVQDGLPE